MQCSKPRQCLAVLVASRRLYPVDMVPLHIRVFDPADWPGEHYDMWGSPASAHMAWCDAREQYAWEHGVELNPWDGLWALVAVGACDAGLVQAAQDGA
jgi:hypothetical protein